MGLNLKNRHDFVSVYINNVLILEEHLKHLHHVIQEIKDAGLKLKPQLHVEGSRLFGVHPYSYWIEAKPKSDEWVSSATECQGSETVPWPELLLKTFHPPTSYYCTTTLDTDLQNMDVNGWGCSVVVLVKVIHRSGRSTNADTLSDMSLNCRSMYTYFI